MTKAFLWNFGIPGSNLIQKVLKIMPLNKKDSTSPIILI